MSPVDMANKPETRQWRDAVREALNSLDAAERYEYRQRDLRRGSGRAEARARPLEFDSGGFPLPQPVPAFTQRLTRLIRDN